MIEQEDHKDKFTAEDIERYYKGKMTAQEMHSMEKAALDDPFLADALEGYSHTKNPVADSQFLNKELQSRLGNNKVVVLQKEKSTTQLWKIAALFILVAGLGWAVYQFSFNNSAKDMATATPAPAEKKPADTNFSYPNQQTNSVSGLTNTEIKMPARASAQQTTTIKKEDQLSTKEEQLLTRNNRAGFAPPIGNRNVSLSAPLSNDSNTNMASNTTKPEATAVTDAPTQPEAFSQARKQKENVIVLQRAKDSSMNEVLLGKSRKDSNYRKPKISFEEAEPQEGQLYYDDYIVENLKVPEKENFKTKSGEVKLSFDINDAGQAINIKVEKSLCDECDKEAIRLLKDGPKLVKKQKNKKGKLSIRF